METDLLGIMRSRLAEAESDAQRLRDAIAVIEGGGNGTAPAPRRRQSKKEEAAPVPEAAKVVPLGKLVSTLRSDPGQSASRLAKNSGGDQGAILALLKEAEAASKVRREGERRGTVWFVITDEDRANSAEAEVATRAAEIEARSTKAPRKRVHRTPKAKTAAKTEAAKDETPAPASQSPEPSSETTPEKNSAAEVTAPAA